MPLELWVCTNAHLISRVNRVDDALGSGWLVLPRPARNIEPTIAKIASRLSTDAVLFMTPSGSENQLDLHPHAANAAVCEIPIQEVERWGVDVHVRDPSELRMVQGIEGFPAKRQTSLIKGTCSVNRDCAGTLTLVPPSETFQTGISRYSVRSRTIKASEHGLFLVLQG